MVIVKETIKVRLDKQKFIYLYLNILKIKSNNKLSNEEIVELLDVNFNYKVTIDDIKLFFEPTIDEESLDLQLQMKHLT
jgi:hypothetical protein